MTNVTETSRRVTPPGSNDHDRVAEPVPAGDPVQAPADRPAATPTDEERHRSERRTYGGAMLVIAAAALVWMATPWIVRSDVPEASGAVLVAGGLAAAALVILGLCGARELLGHRVRLGGAAVGLFVVAAITMAAYVTQLSDGDTAHFDAGDDTSLSVEVPSMIPVAPDGNVEIGGIRAAVDRTDSPDFGLTMAAFAVIGVVVPLVFLLEDDRRRRGVTA